MAENGVIGRDNALPWHLPADLRRFKTLTTGHAIVMGRRTFESIGRALPDRSTIVVSTNPDYQAPGVTTATSLTEALERAQADDPEGEVFVVGGARIYREALPLADRLYMTVVHARVEGDVRFPPWNPSDWRLVEFVRQEPDAKHAYELSFRCYHRRPGRPAP